MIRKVPNINAWVLKICDLDLFLGISSLRYRGWMIYDLPLFSIDPSIKNITYFLFNKDKNDLVLIISNSYELKNFTLEEVEEINKTWNKFYEDKNKET